MHQLLFIFVILFIGYFLYSNVEHFYLGSYAVPLATRHTRNMSYDIRGDPFFTVPQTFPWLNSELVPL